MPHANRDNAVNRGRVYRADESYGLLRNRAQRVPDEQTFHCSPGSRFFFPFLLDKPSSPHSSLFAAEKLEIFNLRERTNDFFSTDYSTGKNSKSVAKSWSFYANAENVSISEKKNHDDSFMIVHFI